MAYSPYEIQFSCEYAMNHLHGLTNDVDFQANFSEGEFQFKPVD